MRRLGLLFGGPSVEHEVSITSARSVFANVDREAFCAVPVGMTKEGAWVEGEEAERMLLGGEYTPSDRPLTAILQEEEIHVVFPLIHGTFGEDGTLQGYLRSLGVPYVGCGVHASSLGMDKAACKAVWQREGLRVVPYHILRREFWREALESLAGKIPFPAFVKPADCGSSVGISRVRDASGLENAVLHAFTVSRKILLEEAVEGRELEVGLLGGYEPDVVSVPGEIVPGAEFYNYEDKYVNDEARVIVPADLSPEVVEEAKSMATKAYISIDAFGMARADFFLDRSGTLFLNEINTIPGFTPISMYPKLMEHAGLSFTNLITRLVDLTGV